MQARILLAVENRQNTMNQVNTIAKTLKLYCANGVISILTDNNCNTINMKTTLKY